MNFLCGGVHSRVGESRGEVGDKREDCVDADEREDVSGRHPRNRNLAWTTPGDEQLGKTPKERVNNKKQVRQSD